MHHQVNLDLFVGVIANQHFLRVLLLCLHLVCWVLTWERCSFPSSQLDFGVKSRDFVNYFAQKLLLKVDHLFQRLLSLALLVERFAHSAPVLWLLRLLVTLFTSLPQKLLCQSIRELLVHNQLLKGARVVGESFQDVFENL